MSGFHHAAATKTCILATATLSLALALADMQQYAHVQWVPHMRTYHQVRCLSLLLILGLPELMARTSTGGCSSIRLLSRIPSSC